MMVFLARCRRGCAAVALPLFCFLPAIVFGQNAVQEKLFEQHVRPVLVERCFACHSHKKQEGGLRLDSREFLLKGNDSGPAVVVGQPDKSRLLQVLAYDDGDIQMPPAGKLPAKEIAALQRWIADGVYWPKSFTPKATDPDAWRKHWAFQPVKQPPLPTVKQTTWPLNEVDRFLLSRLETAGLQPSAEVDRRTWLRRVTFVLTGLPTTPAELAAFETDKSDSARATVVDRLLSTPAFGERWGRHWLDVARYADTKGYVFREDRNYPHAWTYRDWVIRAFNEDMPVNRFLELQLAADRLTDDKTVGEQAAMGFLTLGRRFLNNKHDIIDDRIDVMTRGMMGLTVACARCHDHKYDPIPAADYYSLYGVFNSSEEPKKEPAPLSLVDAKQPRNPYVFLRGQAGNRGKSVPRQFLLVASTGDRQPFKDGSGRLEMARAITDPANPLTARVFVNRVWGHVWGSYLVDTPSDFGVRSDPPTHPLLLDWLASDFVRHDWSLKHLLRNIVLSRAFQQQSRHRPDCAVVDPENKLLWRANRRRLDLEAHRDALLMTAGQLDRTIGGKSVNIIDAPFSSRRTVYGFIDRQNLPGLFRTFDFAGPDQHSPKRYATTVPQQALFQLNSPFLLQQAEALAARTKSAKTARDRVQSLYQLVFNRPPTSEELNTAVAYISSADTTPSTIDTTTAAAAWSYGFGRLNDTATAVASFTPLPHWTGSAWQGGPKLPDSQHGWAMLNPIGGHVGESPTYLVIRRWTAPVDGVVQINGQFRHRSDQGDGVRGRIISSGGNRLGEWSVHNRGTNTNIARVKVNAGDTVDFVTDSKGTINFDSFDWKVELKYQNVNPQTLSPTQFASQRDFRGPQPEPPDIWARYAQVLLLTNEFVFVD